MASLRDYQDKIVRVAREQNVVMVGNTGIGKTFVAIMLLREQDYSTKKAFVLAPTRQLVYQIHSKIVKLTTLKVEAYCGRELDVWDQMKWDHEILLNSVFVCTPEILRNLITKGYISMTKINLLIFDECHHVSKRHPYNQIMKLYDPSNSNYPRIFGTTACPTKDCSRNMHATIEKVSLNPQELTIYAACAPVLHETYEPNVDCHPSTVVNIVTELLTEIKLVEVFSQLLSQGKHREKSTLEIRGKRITKLRDDCAVIYQSLGPWCMYRFLELEIEKQARSSSVRWTQPGSVVGLNMDAVEVLLRCVDKRIQTRMACTPKVEKIVDIINKKLFSEKVSMVDGTGDTSIDLEVPDDETPAEDTIFFDAKDIDDDSDASDDGMETVEDEVAFEPLPEHSVENPRVDFDRELKCVIFVNRRAECRVLSDYLNEKFPLKSKRNEDDDERLEINDMVHNQVVKPGLFGCMLGQASSSDAASYNVPDMHQLLRAFESGVVRVLVSTSVSCEGVDFPLCSMVICADTLTCPRRFIQVRGRARHADGVCFYLTDVSSVQDGEQFLNLSRQAEAIGRLDFKSDKTVTITMEPRSVVAQGFAFNYTIIGLEDGELVHSNCSLIVEKSGSILDLDSSISCLNMFCQSLPNYELENLKPIYKFNEKLIDRKTAFQAILTLPAMLSIPTMKTSFMQSKSISKSLVAFRACEILFQNGKLDENLNSIYRRRRLIH